MPSAPPVAENEMSEAFGYKIIIEPAA
jgi:hypothetical protein